MLLRGEGVMTNNVLGRDWPRATPKLVEPITVGTKRTCIFWDDFDVVVVRFRGLLPALNVGQLLLVPLHLGPSELGQLLRQPEKEQDDFDVHYHLDALASHRINLPLPLESYGKLHNQTFSLSYHSLLCKVNKAPVKGRKTLACEFLVLIKSTFCNYSCWLGSHCV